MSDGDHDIHYLMENIYGILPIIVIMEFLQCSCSRVVATLIKTHYSWWHLDPCGLMEGAKLGVFQFGLPVTQIRPMSNIRYIGS